MITLNLEDYCQEGCMRFEPKVLKGLRPGDAVIIVSCEHSAECQYMLRYLKKHGLETSDLSDERRNNVSKDNENLELR